jgi:hypothetical protein
MKMYPLGSFLALSARQAHTTQGLFKSFNRTCQDFAQHWIVPTVHHLREVRVNGEPVELHCWIGVLAAKTMQLHSESLDFRAGERIEHSGRQISPGP